MKKVIYYNDLIGVVSKGYPNAQAYIAEEAVRAELRKYFAFAESVQSVIDDMKGGEA